MTVRSLWELRSPLVGGGRMVDYDDVQGKIVSLAPTAPKTGKCFWVGGKLLARYVDRGRMIFQVGPDKFDLDAAETEATKENDYKTGTTTFYIRQGKRQRSLVYPGWWVGIINPPEGVGGLPEMDEEEDSLGAIFELLRSPEGRALDKKALLEQW